MKLLCGAVLLAVAARGANFAAHGVDPAAWTKVFGAIGVTPAISDTTATVVITNADDSRAIQALAEQHIVIVQGTGAALPDLGFMRKAGADCQVRHITDVHAPKTEILWEQSVGIPVWQAPSDFQVFAREKWTGMPVLAGKRTCKGAVLWVATDPGVNGMERYPYFLHAAVDLGLDLPARATTLWAFFDSAYRIRADPDYLATRWRSAGISVIHAAAWHNMEPDAAQDGYLTRLIEACHRHNILVYAWLELPHVSEKFWNDHAAWREKTALGQDAQLDWRKLMNLTDPDCRRAAQQTVGELLQRFDWDGVNLAELYFESLEGASNPARFTPMNDAVRSTFRQEAGFDPQALFDPNSPLAAVRNPQGLRRFLDYRAELAARLQAEWLVDLDGEKRRKRYLDVVLTHIDDRFETGMRDALGADVARTLPVLAQRRETLLVEDPATLWALGPERYAKLAAKYQELAASKNNLAVDINVVERYQDVYPTKKQTGVELLELVHQAAASFRRVALYVENSIAKQDLAMLPVAASVTRVERSAVDEWTVEGADATRLSWHGPAELDGKVWPLQSAQDVLVPPGKHRLSPGFEAPLVRATDFNGEVRLVSATHGQVELAYLSRSRALTTLEGAIERLELDGLPIPVPAQVGGVTHLMLPAGQHLLSVSASVP